MNQEQLRSLKIRKRLQRIKEAEKIKEYYIRTKHTIKATAMDKFITWAKANLYRP
jgi:hypothetical protein